MAVRRRSPSAPVWQFPIARRYFYYSPQKLKDLEKGFVLDGVPLSKLANDEVGRTHPTLNLGIPQYTAIKDPHCRLYYSRNSYVKDRLESETNDNSLANASMMGSVYDKFIHKSTAKEYIDDRKKLGAGYTRQIYGGHMSVPTDAPTPGYHGENGYRRNTPDLRSKPSPFDCEDPFEEAKPYYLKLRPALSAPGNIQQFRTKSVQLYSQPAMTVTKKATA